MYLNSQPDCLDFYSGATLRKSVTGLGQNFHTIKMYLITECHRRVVAEFKGVNACTSQLEVLHTAAACITDRTRGRHLALSEEINHVPRGSTEGPAWLLLPTPVPALGGSADGSNDWVPPTHPCGRPGFNC